MKVKFSCLAILFSILISSCQKEKKFVNIQNEMSEVSAKETALEKFSTILSKAIVSNIDLREFIKQEALLQKDNDFDVIYALCKNQLVGGEKTFKEVLESYETSKGEIDSIENLLPTITILIPSLPNDFNADNWSPKDEIPVIAYERKKTIDFFYNGKKEISLTRDQIPGFPTLLVKENERIRVSNSSLKASIKGGNNFTFVNEAFDGINNKPKNQKNISTKKASNSILRDRVPTTYDKYYFELSQKITDGYQKFLPQDGGWQRDYIYYNLENVPNAKGNLDQTFTESIMAIKIHPAALAIIMDQDDPRYNTDFSWSPRDGYKAESKMWTDGNFEIQIDIIISDIEGGGAATSKVLSIPPLELFDIVYDQQTLGNPIGGDYSVIYKFKEIKSKFYYCNLPIKEWNLEKMGYTWKFSVRENDDNTVYSDTETITTKYATNFSFEPGGLFKQKLGLKFGGSAEESRTNTTSVQRTKSNDFLGEAFANFGDAILKSGTKFTPRSASFDIIDLKSATYRQSATQYANFVPKKSREPVPYTNWLQEQSTIKSTATNVYPLSNFNTILNNNFEILMLPVYKY